MTIDTWWLSITATAYAVAKTKGQSKLQYRYVDEVARSVISNFPSAPHLYALEQLMSVGNLHPDLWRQVLAKIDELEAQNGRETKERIGGVEEHSVRRQAEPQGIGHDDSRADDSNAQRQGAPDGADESAQ